MKKILTLLLAIFLVVTFIPIFATAEELPTQHSETSGWIGISTASEFVGMAATGKYYLENDISFENYYSNSVQSSYLVKVFSGNLEGNNKTIYGFGNKSVFGTIASSATTTVTNLTVRVNDTTALSDFGFLTATHSGAGKYTLVIDNVDVYGNCTAIGNVSVGGFVGCLDKDSDNNARSAVIKKCEVNATLDGSIVGGMIGSSEFT